MSSFGWKEEDVARMLAGRGKQVPLPTPKPSKMHNIFEECDGMTFRSKKEAAYYRQLKVRQAAKGGDILYFHWQVPIRLPGNTKYTVDFQEFHKDGTVHYVDTKGHRTKEFIKAKKQVEALYPVRIEEV